MANSTRLTPEMLERAMEATQNGVYEPYVFVGTRDRCEWYARHVLRCSEEEIAAWRDKLSHPEGRVDTLGEQVATEQEGE